MAYSSSSSNANSKVHTCSTECEQSYAQLKKLYDTQREQLGDASIEIQAYTQALKKVEAQLVAHQKNQLWYEEKIRFMKIDLDDKTDVLTYHKKLLAEAVKEKEELKTKLESFETSSKSLNTLLNSQLSANDKVGFGRNVEMPKIKTVRMSEPIIEEWESDSEDDEIVVKPKEVTKSVKPSFEKIKSVNARNETVRQAENPKKNKKSPREKKLEWFDDSKIRAIHKESVIVYYCGLYFCALWTNIVQEKRSVEEEGLVTRGLLFWELINAADAKVENKVCIGFIQYKSGEQKFVLCSGLSCASDVKKKRSGYKRDDVVLLDVITTAIGFMITSFGHR
ncbi:hypothetical protein Tco_0729579 [Tanacetum coccineum]|uniref:Uncharacterized protein n=1 Tax=Tanacetum coccineum TaxID=301880 RepID=A0ABQ4YSE1_9ASTR